MERMYIMAGIVHELEKKDLLLARCGGRRPTPPSSWWRRRICTRGRSLWWAAAPARWWASVGSWSTPEVAPGHFQGLNSVFAPRAYIAAQCCEHLNRALIVEHEAVPGAEIVNVKPQPKAGSSFATAAYNASATPWRWRRSRPTPVWTSAVR